MAVKLRVLIIQVTGNWTHWKSVMNRTRMLTQWVCKVWIIPSSAV